MWEPQIRTHAAAALAAVQDRAHLCGLHAEALGVAAVALEAAQGGAFSNVRLPVSGQPCCGRAHSASRLVPKNWSLCPTSILPSF